MNEQSEPPVQRAGPLVPGDTVASKYRIEAAAGEGGMAIVYAAHHLVLDQRVAVKVLTGDGAGDEVSTERFVREAQAAARLQSEHAVRVMDAGVLPSGQPYLVMEFLEGCDLAELIALSGPMEVPEFSDYMLQALEGIAHAHAAGIVHRDLKPSNLFLTLRPDGSNTIKVLDFGISKSTVDGRGLDVTKLTGQAVLGSPAYMSPEQIRSASSVDARSDVWSLGAAMYELLTGVMPFQGDGVGEMLAAILEAEPVAVHVVRPQVPVGLSDAVMRCLRRNRDDRWPDVAGLARALAPFATRASAALPARIAATLTHAARLRPPTPLGAFPVTSLAALGAAADIDAAATPAPSARARALEAGRSGDPFAATQPQRSVVAWAATKPGRPPRSAFLLAGLCAGAILVLGLTRGRGAPAASSSAALGSPRASPLAASPPPEPLTKTPKSPGMAAAPAASAAGLGPSQAPAPSSVAAALRRAPRAVPPTPPSSSTRPSILHSRN